MCPQIGNYSSFVNSKSLIYLNKYYCLTRLSKQNINVYSGVMTLSLPVRR